MTMPEGEKEDDKNKDRKLKAGEYFIARSVWEPIDTSAAGERLENLRRHLKSRIVGQDKAIERVVGMFQQDLLRDPDLPRGVIGFAGDHKGHGGDREIYRMVKTAVQKTFPAELMGRLKENLVVFRPLGEKISMSWLILA